jgi:hypothetical protein
MTEGEQEQLLIGAEVTAFASHIDSLRQTLPMTMMLIQAFNAEAQKKLTAFEDVNCIATREEAGRRVEIPIDHYSKWKRLKHRFDQAFLARRLVPRSIFVSLLSQYDAFLGNVLRQIFIARPELLNPSKREFTFSEIARFPTIQAARDSIITKEVEAVLRTSHVDQIKWMENRFGLTLTKLEVWPKFVEITQRRNLFVHADGLVSGQYLKECQDAECKIEKNISEGKRLGVPQKYFDQACMIVSEVGIKLAHVLWRKLFPAQMERADNNLIEIAYDLIDRNDYALAIALLSFAVNELKKHSDEAKRLVFVVNLAQAYKWHGASDKCQIILEQEDWSAKGEEFKLSESVLRMDWARAGRLVRKIGSDGAVKKVDYRDWPLFKEFRLRSEFLEAYQQVFGESFPATVEPKLSDPEGQTLEEAPISGEADSLEDGTHQGIVLSQESGIDDRQNLLTELEDVSAGFPSNELPPPAATN